MVGEPVALRGARRGDVVSYPRYIFVVHSPTTRLFEGGLINVFLVSHFSRVPPEQRMVPSRNLLH